MSRSLTLLISPFFFPEIISTGKYNTTLATELATRFDGLNVLCAHPFYPDWTPVESDARLPRVGITRGGRWLRYPRSTIVRRLILEVWFALFVAENLWKMRHQVRNVILVFPPVGFALVTRALLPKPVRIIGIVHDILGVMARSKDSAVHRLVAKLMARIERRAFLVCDELICLSSAMRNVLSDTYGIYPNRITVHYPFATVAPSAARLAVLAELDTGKKNIVYAGALGEKQVPALLFAVMSTLTEVRSDVVCHIFSAGPIFESLKRKPRDPDRFLFHSLVEEGKLPELYAGSFLQLIPQAENTGAGAFPSKYPNLVSSGTPIFAVCDKDSELDQLVSRTACARSTHHRTTAGIVRDLAAFIDAIQVRGSSSCQQENDQLVRELFDVGTLADWLDALLHSDRRPA